MLDWVFEGIVTWISSMVTKVMDAVSGLFLDALGTDMTAMEEYFPFATKAFSVIQYTAWAILFLVTVWQLFRVFGGPITEAENPMVLLARGALFALLIGYAKQIFTLALNIARAPYTALMGVSMTSEDFSFAGIEEALKNGLTTFVEIGTVVGLLLLVILMVSLGWNYFKLLLETVERYVVVGVLCYTSPLAYSLGSSKATSNVFRSWCRMIGSQLLLLVMNVWFLRAFDSSVGYFIGTGGTLTNGHGGVFLWLFCALAFLKTAQRFDSYLASLGLNVAQTGSSMGMELLIAARTIGGFGGGGRTAGGVFKGGSGAGGGTTSAAGGGASTGGMFSGFASRFKPNSYVRDAVVTGSDANMGTGGAFGFVGRAVGGVAARNGATLTSESISSVAARAPSVSGSIAGDIADRSLQNYMPQLGGYQLQNTEISGGRISTTAIGADGKSTDVEMFNASQFEKPDAPHSVVTAEDGSSWYQMASGPGASEFYGTPAFTGGMEEAAQVASTFPDAEEGTTLRTVEDGVMEATAPDGGNSLWYSSAFFDEPDAPHTTMQSSDGVEWYAMQQQAETPDFEPPAMGGYESGTGVGGGFAPDQTDVAGAAGISYDFGEGVVPGQDGVAGADGIVYDVGIGAGAMPGQSGVGDAGGISFDAGTGNAVEQPDMAGAGGIQFDAGGGFTPGAGIEPVPEFVPGSGTVFGDGKSSTTFATAEMADAFNVAQFKSFMPGFSEKVTSVDGAGSKDGHFEVRHENGSGTIFYDTARYAEPRGDHKVIEDVRGGKWYAIHGEPATERRPVYEHGKPVYDGQNVKTTVVETVRYKSTPARYAAPKRKKTEIKAPKRKKR